MSSTKQGTTIAMPKLGESVTEGTLGSWLKAVGDVVEKYEPLVEVVTDKVTAEIPAPVSGTIVAIVGDEGETIPVGGTICVIDEGGEAVAAEIQRLGGEAIFMRHDVVDESQWEQVTKLAEDRFGGLNILVNNAGIAPEGGPIEDKTLEQWRHTLAVDLDSVFLGCKHGIRTIKKTTVKGGSGSIINISSILGLVGSANASDYNAAKGGVRLLSKAAALECAEAGYRIRVNSVHPGYIDTPMVRGVVDRGMSGMPVSGNEMIQFLTMLHPIGRLGVADEIANTVLFLASDESSFITGAELVVDGGYTTR